MFQQIVAVTSISLSGLRSRLGMSFVIMLSVAAVVGVLISMFAMRAGMEQAVGQEANPAHVVMLDANSGQGSGNFPASDLPIIADLPGVAHDSDGNALIDPLVVGAASVVNKFSALRWNVQVIGASKFLPQVYPQFHLVAGRMYHSGLRELIVGRGANALYKNLRIGDRIHVKGVDWTIVGVFEFGGSFEESFLYGDLTTEQSEFKLPAYNEIIVQLTSPDAFPQFSEAVESNPVLRLRGARESDWMASQFKYFYNLIDIFGFLISGVMALGAVCAALNVMYTAIDQRKTEIATLRAIGFGGTAVAISVVAETLLVAIPGACLGTLIAFLAFNNNQVFTDGLIFHMVVTSHLVGQAFFWTIGISLVGSFPPALRAARVPVATALRAV